MTARVPSQVELAKGGRRRRGRGYYWRVFLLSFPINSVDRGGQCQRHVLLIPVNDKMALLLLLVKRGNSISAFSLGSVNGTGKGATDDKGLKLFIAMINVQNYFNKIDIEHLS